MQLVPPSDRGTGAVVALGRGGWQILADIHGGTRMTGPGRVLGLDVGSRTIGVAVTDELGVAAHPVTTLARKGTLPDVQAVLALAQKYGAHRAVMGMPYDEEGEEGPRAKRVRVFLEALEAAGLPVTPWDERFTTIEAEAVLLEADLSRKKRKKVIDRLAAQIILQNWLEAR